MKRYFAVNRFPDEVVELRLGTAIVAVDGDRAEIPVSGDVSGYASALEAVRRPDKVGAVVLLERAGMLDAEWLDQLNGMRRLVGVPVPDPDGEG